MMTAETVCRSLALALILAALLPACARPQPTPTPTAVAPTSTPAPGLRRGVNMGNDMEAPRGEDWGYKMRAEHFARIREAGFDHVRIPMRWSDYAAQEPPYTIEPAFFERADWAVRQGLDNRLSVILNIHHYLEIMEAPEAHKARFLAIWGQIAEHYRDYPQTLYFELLNEPNGRLTAALWNEYLAEAIAVIRKTNPTRKIVVGTAEWGGLTALAQLQIPADDPHLIVTYHYYNPFPFTHQGAEWVQGSNAWLGTMWEGAYYQQNDIRADFDIAVRWAKERGVPLYMGEFGAYSKADMASRVRWTAFCAREAEARGIAWAYWEFGAGFGVYDPAVGRWRAELLKALIPE